MQFGLSSTRKQIFSLLKPELLENSSQGKTFQETPLYYLHVHRKLFFFFGTCDICLCDLTSEATVHVYVYIHLLSHYNEDGRNQIAFSFVLFQCNNQK